MALITVTIPNPVLPVGLGWEFKVRYTQVIIGQPANWVIIAPQSNAPFYLTLSQGLYFMEVILSIDGSDCPPVYYCFRVLPACVGCPTAVALSFYNGANGIKYLQVDMKFANGFPVCGLLVAAHITALAYIWNASQTVPTLSGLVPVVIAGQTWYRCNFVITGVASFSTHAYTVSIRSQCCSYSTLCFTGIASG